MTAKMANDRHRGQCHESPVIVVPPMAGCCERSNAAEVPAAALKVGASDFCASTNQPITIPFRQGWRLNFQAPTIISRNQATR
jgi:hypothetical protein